MNYISENVVGFVAALFIITTFALAAIYYFKLYAFMRSLRKMDQLIWSTWRSKAKPRDIDLKVAYRILMDPSSSANLSDESSSLGKMARRYLYTTFALFMILLFIGLLISVDK